MSIYDGIIGGIVVVGINNLVPYFKRKYDYRKIRDALRVEVNQNYEKLNTFWKEINRKIEENDPDSMFAIQIDSNKEWDRELRYILDLLPEWNKITWETHLGKAPLVLGKGRFYHYVHEFYSKLDTIGEIFGELKRLQEIEQKSQSTDMFYVSQVWDKFSRNVKEARILADSLVKKL